MVRSSELLGGMMILAKKGIAGERMREIVMTRVSIDQSLILLYSLISYKYRVQLHVSFPRYLGQ